MQRVYDAWVMATGRTAQTRLDKPRQAAITRALNTYPLDDVLDAVRGWRHSPHHRGDNETGAVYNDLTLLLRNGEHIKKFRDLERRSETVIKQSPDTQRRDILREKYK